MATKLAGIKSIWKLATGQAPDLDRAHLQVIRDELDKLRGLDISDANSALVLQFVEELSSAQGTLEQRMNKLAHELFPPMLTLVTDISDDLTVSDQDRKDALKFARETNSRIASSMALDAARSHREAKAIREENLRHLIAKAMALIEIHEAVKRMMTEQNAPIQAASTELADIRTALEMQQKAKMDLAQARRQELAVTVELDQIISKRVPEIADEMQRVAAQYLDILDSAEVLFGERRTGKQLQKADAMDKAFSQLCRVQDREQDVLKQIGALRKIEITPSDVTLTARQVSAKMRKALGENDTPKPKKLIRENTNRISYNNLNEEVKTEDELDALAAQIEKHQVKTPEAREILAWAVNKNIFRKTTPSRIRLAKAINKNRGFSKEDRNTLYGIACAGIEKMFTNRY